MLLLGVQPAHESLEMPIDENTTYYQEIKYDENLINKKYFVNQDGNQVAYQESTYRRFNEEELDQLLSQSGLKDVGEDKTGQFRIFEKLS